MSPGGDRGGAWCGAVAAVGRAAALFYPARSLPAARAAAPVREWRPRRPLVQGGSRVGGLGVGAGSRYVSDTTLPGDSRGLSPPQIISYARPAPPPPQKGLSRTQAVITCEGQTRHKPHLSIIYRLAAFFRGLGAINHGELRHQAGNSPLNRPHCAIKMYILARVVPTSPRGCLIRATTALHAPKCPPAPLSGGSYVPGDLFPLREQVFDQKSA